MLSPRFASGPRGFSFGPANDNKKGGASGSALSFAHGERQESRET